MSALSSEVESFDGQTGGNARRRGHCFKPVYFLFALLVAGCSPTNVARHIGQTLGESLVSISPGSTRASGQSFARIQPLPQKQAVVYIYRVRTAGELSGYPEIFVDGQRQFRLLLDGYGIVYLPPGEHEIVVRGSFWTDWLQEPVTRRFDAVVSEEYYIRVRRDPAGVSVTLQASTSALPDITWLHLLTETD